MILFSESCAGDVLLYIYYVGVCPPEQTLAVRVGKAEHVVM